MVAIPGDSNYGEEVIAPQIDEITKRLAKFVKEAKGLPSLLRALDYFDEEIGRLGLGDDQAISDALAAAVEPSAEVLELATKVFEKLMSLTGVEIEPIADPISKTSDGETKKVSDLQILPVELRGRDYPEAKHMLGKRIFGLTPEEVKASKDLVKKAEAIVAVTDDGEGLIVVKGKLPKATLEGLPETQTRLLNLYIRYLVNNPGEFRRADANAPFGPPNGFDNFSTNMSGVNTKLGEKLGIPALFTGNGLLRADARYSITSKVVFVNEDVIKSGILGSA